MGKKINLIDIAEQYSNGLIDEKNPLMVQATNALRELASTNDGLDELAEVIGIYIDKTFNNFDITPYIAYNKKFNLGDKPEFKLKEKGIKAYIQAPDAYTPKTRNYQETLSMEFETISVRPECFIDEIKAGRITSFAELIKDAQDAIRVAIASRVFELLGQVYNETKNKENFKLETTKLTAEGLTKAIQYVKYKTGKKPVIMGDQLLCNQISEFDGFSDATKREIEVNGVLGYYKGATILEIPECINPATGKSYVPTNRLYVVGSKIGYSATYGDAKTGQESSIDDWSWNARIDKEWGFVVTQAKGLFVIEVR